MNMYEKITQMSDDELAIFLDLVSDGSCEMVWDTWFNEIYCESCAAIEVENGYFDDHTEAFCEHYNYCPYSEKHQCITTHDIIKLWLKEGGTCD